VTLNPRTALHHIVLGVGPPILLLHGLFDTLQTWERLIPLLSHRFTVFAIDFPGFGKTILPKAWGDSMMGMADAVIGFLDEQGIEQIALVGNSMGAGVALAICEAHPERVSRIVLLNPYGLPQMPMAAQSAQSAIAGLLPYLLPRGALRQCAKRIFSRALFDPNQLTESLLAQRVEPFSSLQRRKDLFRFLRGVSTQTLAAIDQKLPRITQPVLILWGINDRWLSGSHWMHLEKRLPHATVTRIANCGHLPQIDKPNDVAAALLPFLSPSQLNR